MWLKSFYISFVQSFYWSKDNKHELICHSFVCVCVLTCSVVSDSLWPLWTIAHQAPLSKGFSQQVHWSGLPFSPLRDLPDPGIEPTSPALHVDSPPGKLCHSFITHYCGPLPCVMVKIKKKYKRYAQYMFICTFNYEYFFLPEIQLFGHLMLRNYPKKWLKVATIFLRVHDSDVWAVCEGISLSLFPVASAGELQMARDCWNGLMWVRSLESLFSMDSSVIFHLMSSCG